MTYDIFEDYERMKREDAWDWTPINPYKLGDATIPELLAARAEMLAFPIDLSTPEGHMDRCAVEDWLDFWAGEMAERFLRN